MSIRSLVVAVVKVLHAELGECCSISGAPDALVVPLEDAQKLNELDLVAQAHADSR